MMGLCGWGGGGGEGRALICVSQKKITERTDIMRQNENLYSRK